MGTDARAATPTDLVLFLDHIAHGEACTMRLVRAGYRQFCPVALASETLTQRWMLLVLRELCAGAARFSDIRRGVPGITATLLKQRLDTLERAGILERPPARGRERPPYRLTQAGEELRPVLASIGTWGQRWARDIREEDLDPGWLVWTMHRRIDTTAMPPGRTVIGIVFRDAAEHGRRFWLVCSAPDVEVCLQPPGFEEDLVVTTSVRVLAEVWRGLRPIGPEIRAGRLALAGPTALRRAFPRWLLLSAYASVRRPTTTTAAARGSTTSSHPSRT
jgi:DNA-binding HxlR family transcriptional regulator